MAKKKPAAGRRLPGPQDLKGRKILIVDDDRTVRDTVREGLADAGYAFHEAQNGEEALAVVRDVMPDLVVSDVHMPKMTGFDVCRIMKSNTRFSHIPFILMTAQEESEAKVEGLELGADDFLVKPVNLLELRARVRSMLRIKALSDQLRAANDRLQENNEKLQELSMTDTLTGIYNRLYFNKRFSYEFQRAMRYDIAMTCVMIDLDHFKSVNDTHGHQVGDAVLHGVAEVLAAGLRNVDILARYGGEEIVAVLPETPLEQGLAVAERLRETVAETQFPRGEGAFISVTISLGVAAYPRKGVNTDEDLLRFADGALYRAKELGRNRVEVAQ